MNLLTKRPVITLFVIYAVALIILDYVSFFSPERRSALLHFADTKTNVTMQGRVISEPQNANSRKRFIFKTSEVNGKNIAEKILVNSPAGYSVSYGDILVLEGRLKKPPQAYFPLVFDYRTYLARENIYTTFDVSYFEFIKSKPSFLQYAAFAIRRDFVTKINAYFTKGQADVLNAVIIGDRTALGTDIKQIFTDAGLMYVLVVSGLHLAYVSVIFLFLFKLTGLNLKKASLLSIPFVFMYAFVTGAQPPVMRAAIMFSCMLVSLALDREPLIYNSLALSALLILIFAPQQLFTASFQMSYLATIGIVAFYPKIRVVFRGVRNPVLKLITETFAITVSVQIMMIPICMYYFGKIPIISFISNVVVAPTLGVIITSGIVFYVFTFISHALAVVAAFALSWITQAVIFVTAFFANLKYSNITVAKPDIPQLVLYYLFILAVIAFKKRLRLLVSVAVLIFLIAYTIISNSIAKTTVYDSSYATVTYVRNGSDKFTIISKRKYYDKYYIKAFKDFLAYSGIKKADITVIGFSEKIAQDFRTIQ